MNTTVTSHINISVKEIDLRTAKNFSRFITSLSIADRKIRTNKFSGN